MIFAGGAAARAGLHAGDKIIKVNKNKLLKFNRKRNIERKDLIITFSFICVIYFDYLIYIYLCTFLHLHPRKIFILYIETLRVIIACRLFSSCACVFSCITSLQPIAYL